MIPVLSLSEGLGYAELTLLALVQGLTEFLPISSSGHLVLTERAIGHIQDPLLVDVALHVGTLIAVVAVYRRDVAGLFRDLLAGRLREIALIVLATIPVGLVGILFKDLLRELFQNGTAAATGLLATAVILGWGERGRRKALAEPSGDREVRPLTILDALLIGCGQALAILPGISRSGTTIAVGLWRGLPAAQAARFSFLISIPAILAATVLELGGVGAGDLTGGEMLLLLWAVLFAGLVGWGALRLLLAFLGRGAFAWFALYCAALGTGTLLFWTG